MIYYKHVQIIILQNNWINLSDWSLMNLLIDHVSLFKSFKSIKALRFNKKSNTSKAVRSITVSLCVIWISRDLHTNYMPWLCNTSQQKQIPQKYRNFFDRILVFIATNIVSWLVPKLYLRWIKYSFHRLYICNLW